MVFNLDKNNIITTAYVTALNTYEKFTHWYWNRKPHHVTCNICYTTLRSDECKYSPEECGWMCTKNGWRWICHRCLDHRDFRPYLKQADEEERRIWEHASGGSL